MSQTEELENFLKNSNRFGTGFILGAVCATIAIFLFTTKSGKELIEKLKSSDFDFSKLDQLGTGALKKIDSEKIKNPPNSNGKDQITQAQVGDGQESTKPNNPASILGRRFFRHKR